MSNARFDLFGRTPMEVVMPKNVSEAQEIVRGAAGEGHRAVGWGDAAAHRLSPRAI